MYKEEKITDGIYIIKNSKEKPKQPEKQNENTEKFIYRSNGEQIQALQSEFFNLEAEISRMFEANELMMKFDANDYDLIEARSENLELINTKIFRMKEIQIQLTQLCPTNPICSIDVFQSFGNQKNEKENKIKKEEKQKNNENKITEEIDL